MSEEEWRFRLDDMLERANRVLLYTASLTEDHFASNQLVIDAVVQNLLTIGEAANNILAEFRDATPSIPWAAIRGMRNRLIHEYRGIDSAIVWRTATDDIPTPMIALRAVIASKA